MTLLTPNERKSRAIQFVNEWQHETRERAEKDSFWNEFFNIFGISRRKVASFEAQAKRFGNKQGGFIDCFWPGVLLAEHKSRGKNLNDALAQAYGYFEGLKDNELPRYVMVSDFAHFVLEEVDTKTRYELTLQELPDKLHVFTFMTGGIATHYQDEDPINIKAAEKLQRLYQSLLTNGYEAHANRLFLVRIMFLCYAEDIGIFEKNAFADALRQHTKEDGRDTGRFLDELFEVLNTPTSQRQTHLDESLKAFPYVNGSVFAQPLRKPAFTPEQRELLLDCCALDWTHVSPAIFGSLFQAAMNGVDRREFGAHYTSEKNILKVISPLFLDALNTELQSILALSATPKRKRLEAFWDKLATLQVMDPACGTGNFLVIIYRELRKLETTLIQALIALDTADPLLNTHLFHAYKSRLFVEQLYGIELDELAVEIARLSLWVTDYQMSVYLSQHTNYPIDDRLPITHEPHIHCANALRLDWDTVCPRERLSYIVGNPPFRGTTYQTAEQKEDVAGVFPSDTAKKLDYVACWHYKASEYMQGTSIKTAFVSTNSICQGEQVAPLWRLLTQKGVQLHFAHQTFQWSNEAPNKAAVFCIILGFALTPCPQPLLFSYETPKSEAVQQTAKTINPYLQDAKPIWVEGRSKPIESFAPIMTKGSQPTDGGHLLLSPEEKEILIHTHHVPEHWIRPFMGSEEFINGKARYCLWLKEVPPQAWRANPEVKRRVEAVKLLRLQSTAQATVKDADKPYEFQAIRQPNSDYLVIPLVSSERREYVPMGMVSSNVIASNLCSFVPDATLWHFAILTSRMHMAWMRVVAGRLKGDYRYSNKLVYNNFVWPPLSPAQHAKLSTLAQAVLDARTPHLASGATLATLYDPVSMPHALRKAHTALDKAVDGCYQSTPFKHDAERVALLFDLYEEAVRPLAKTETPAKKKRVSKVVQPFNEVLHS
ncbi:MAG: class I SAM-dependent DNA methyltransferase [Vampirovibrionales bacterium]